MARTPPPAESSGNKLSDIIKGAVNSAVTQSGVNAQAEVGRVGPGFGPNPLQPRGFASPQDVYDQSVGYESPFNHLAPGAMRAMWSVPDVAVTHTPVNTLTSAGVPNSTQSAQIVGGLVSNPVSPATGFNTVPNMQLQIVTNGPVHVIANLSVQSNVASDLVQFAFYRDGNQVGQIFTHTLPSTTNTASLIHLAIIDNPALVASFLTPHIYALNWKAGTGVLKAATTQRSMYSLKLTPY